MSDKRPCWLVKTEPECFSIHDLAACPRQTTSWDGVRNYQARNFMRDQMQAGDRVLFYHSSVDPPAVAGTAVVARAAYADATAWDPKDQHFDPKASPENPIWQMVDIRLDEIFPVPVPIGTLRATPGLKHMELLRTGSRLSVQPVKPAEFELVLALARQAANDTSPAEKTKPAGARQARPKAAAARSKKPAKAAARRAR
jgi:predicted RNA-binding protein with PUA-like domain